jgi:hypothetical protein
LLSQTFKFYLNPGDWLAVFVKHPPAQGNGSIGGAKTPSEQERRRCSRNSQTMEHEETLLECGGQAPLLRSNLRGLTYHLVFKLKL